MVLLQTNAMSVEGVSAVPVVQIWMPDVNVLPEFV